MPYRNPRSKYWWISYTDASGRRIRRSARTTSHTDARAIEAQERADGITQRPAPGTYSFEQLMTGYLADTADRRSFDRSLYAVAALREQFADTLLHEVTPQRISDYKRARRAAGRQDATIIRELGVFSAALNHAAREWGWPVANPVSAQMPRQPAHRVRWITPEQAAALIEAARAERQAPHLWAFVALGLNTGMRKGEMLGLEWDRLDLGKRRAYLNPTDQKSGRYDVVPLNDAAVAALRDRWGEHPRWVFVRGGERIRDVKKSFASACRRADIEDFTPHDLRHTCASWLVQAGVDLRAVAEVLRHKNITITMRYAHLAPKHAQDAVDVLDGVASTLHVRSGVSKV